MPTYTYTCEWCGGSEFEKNFVPIDERDSQWCDDCGMNLKRHIRFEGSVWAPTAGGMR